MAFIGLLMEKKVFIMKSLLNDFAIYESVDPDYFTKPSDQDILEVCYSLKGSQKKRQEPLFLHDYWVPWFRYGKATFWVSQ
jgi:hypothetical protein